ncbi:MAG: hypothetical protein C4327_14900, partial [Meiothermus sp.]
LALLVLTCLLYPPFRQAVQQIRRYHAAEHMATHALTKTKTDGLPTLAEVRPQPMLHPSCGSNLAMLLLPVTLLGYFLPYWLFLPLIPPFLHLFGWMNHHPEHPLARPVAGPGLPGPAPHPGPSPRPRAAGRPQGPGGAGGGGLRENRGGGERINYPEPNQLAGRLPGRAPGGGRDRDGTGDGGLDEAFWEGNEAHLEFVDEEIT